MRCTTELTARFALTGPSLDFTDIESYYDDEGNFCVPDVLDLDTVSFDSVVEDLSFELYAQDEAEDRALDAGVCACAHCAYEPWNEDALQKVGAKWFCTNCYTKALRDRVFTVESVNEMNAKEFKKSWKQREKMVAAIRTAMTMRPDLNWEQYKRHYGVW